MKTDGPEPIENEWREIEITTIESANVWLGSTDVKRKDEWFNQECKKALTARNHRAQNSRNNQNIQRGKKGSETNLQAKKRKKIKSNRRAIYCRSKEGALLGDTTDKLKFRKAAKRS
ncbi:hypothetical protein ILUMI_22871 [Ignelater luminosus]|uniref:Uncharacterized protein n=1 Tax=Ignelater luminosus TaxID=2038154 RepID=A0A8K0CD22_IGNLU|nr:hypothetical protein ILUMI_22871 [Ignelater luminosus]